MATSVHARPVARASARVTRLALALLLALSPGPGPHAQAAGDVPLVRETARAAILARLALTPAEATAVRDLYGAGDARALWIRDGALTADARAVLARLCGAATHGLRPEDYLIGAAADDVARGATETPAGLDIALTAGTLRYMRHLHLGRVDPRTLGLRLDAWQEPHDFVAMLREAARGGHAAAMVDGLAPPFVVYARLTEALAQVRRVASDTLPPLPVVTAAVKPGASWDGVRVLAQHLAAWGDLPPGDVPAPGASRYEGAVVAGVQGFQRRHGLAPDGVLGGRTVAALRVPAAARVRQIEVALERLRWVPDLGTRRVVAVNIPMFRAWAWDGLGPAAVPAFASDVIVGRAMRTETPVFVETMDHVIFRPYWNVPASILRAEVLPAIRRTPGYLAREQMEIVRGDGDDAVVVPPGPDALAGLAAGRLRVRQRPGPHNALGLVKFVFPNREGVYMHGTPAPALFARDRRDFSHGCIRVADPAGFARWALQGVTGWDGTRIAAAMQGPATRRVDLAAPVDVVLFYLTAAVLPEDGRVHFAEDIYGHDAALERALAQRTRN